MHQESSQDINRSENNDHNKGNFTGNLGGKMADDRTIDNNCFREGGRINRRQSPESESAEGRMRLIWHLDLWHRAGIK